MTDEEKENNKYVLDFWKEENRWRTEQQNKKKE